MSLDYHSLVGHRDGAKKMHIHLTEIADTSAHEPYQHEHQAEEAFYLLEGSAEYTFGGKTMTAGPGEVVFISVYCNASGSIRAICGNAIRAATMISMAMT